MSESLGMWELLLRIAVGTALGGVIGYERNIHGRPAGFRTHMLVALASATFMVVSTHFVYLQRYHEGDLVMVDTSRIAASIVSGMGFLAGGAILRTGLSVQGLTTAAALWLVGSIGMAAGSGMFLVAGFATLVGVVTLTILRRFEDKDDHVLHRVEILLGAEGSVKGLTDALRALGILLNTAAYERTLGDGTFLLTLDLRFRKSLELERVLGTLEAQPGVRRVKVEIAG